MALNFVSVASIHAGILGIRRIKLLPKSVDDLNLQNRLPLESVKVSFIWELGPKSFPAKTIKLSLKNIVELDDEHEIAKLVMKTENEVVNQGLADFLG